MSFDLLEIRAAETLADSPALPAKLVTEDGPDAREVNGERRFELGSRDINEMRMDTSRIDEVAELGDTDL